MKIKFNSLMYSIYCQNQDSQVSLIFTGLETPLD